MNFLIVILNRVYFALTKVKNQSPIFGASGLVSLLIFFNIENIILLIYSSKESYHHMDVLIGLFLLLLIFIPVYQFAKSKKEEISQSKIDSPTSKNILVASLFLFTLISFILLANINREKIFKENKHKPPTEKRESLEGKIRKWFED